MTRSARVRMLGAAFAIVAAVLVPTCAAAHPLGNFTINHYTGIRVEPDRILLDVVIDQAEIPTFQSRLDFDTDGDGEVSDAEIDVGRVGACQAFAPSMALTVDGSPLTLTLTAAGLAFPPGVGGLPTMRMVCGFSGTMPASRAPDRRIAYAETSYADQLGWREIVVAGSGMTLRAAEGELRTTSASSRLTTYPTNLLAEALHDTAVAIVASPGGPLIPALEILDASPLPGVIAPSPGASSTPAPSASAETAGASPVAVASPTAGAVPGGVGGADLPSIFRTDDLTPLVLLVSILTAAALGAGHALTPGHGKTVMAAYLVGTRGTPLHAAGLGLSVTLAHTLGILVLAAVVVGAEGLLAPDVVVRSLPTGAAIAITAVGAWMLVREGRRRRAARAGPMAAAPDSQLHRHGGVAHSHLPAAAATLSWRNLFVLGLAGGLIPSTSALLILLGSIAAGRPAFGFVLVVAFGLGMALVMGGIGLAMVLARGRLDRLDSASALGRMSGSVPLVAAFVVLGFGLYLTLQAISGNPTF
jgi:nickel/cobalt exporter